MKFPFFNNSHLIRQHNWAVLLESLNVFHIIFYNLLVLLFSVFFKRTTWTLWLWTISYTSIKVKKFRWLRNMWCFRFNILYFELWYVFIVNSHYQNDFVHALSFNWGPSPIPCTYKYSVDWEGAWNMYTKFQIIQTSMDDLMSKEQKIKNNEFYWAWKVKDTFMLMKSVVIM